MKVIDCHVHLNHYEGTPFKPLEERVQDLVNTMHASVVNYAIVLSSYVVNEDRPSVARLLEAIKKHDNIGVVAGYSIDNHTDDDLKFYKECLKDGRIKGLKLYCGYEHYYPYDKRYQKVYDLCVEYGAPDRKSVV